MAVPEGGNGYAISDFRAPYTNSDSAPHVSEERENRNGSGRHLSMDDATFP